MTRAIVLGLALAAAGCWSASTTLDGAELRASGDGGVGVDADPTPVDDGGPTPPQDGGQDAPAGEASSDPADAGGDAYDASAAADGAPDAAAEHDAAVCSPQACWAADNGTPAAHQACLACCAPCTGPCANGCP